jgi:aryl-alcohol dehydrogenase-like predicted oxidoreductase
LDTRPIPSTGERLPIIGCGTWQTFDIGSSRSDYPSRQAVLETLFGVGGSVIDSSPMYGSSERVVGDLLAAMNGHGKAFVATKVWTPGRAAGITQMEQSMRLLRTDRIDLMQIHNLVDWRSHLPTLRDWKREGRIRYVGVTHYQAGAFADLEAAIRDEQFDFLQVNYALDEREAERRLLPLAAERGVAVLVNLPFGAGGLVRKLAHRPLPDWAKEIGAGSWPEVLLKFVLANPAVTCVIPGTSRADHMAINARAGTGPYPDAALAKRMVAAIEG